MKNWRPKDWEKIASKLSIFPLQGENTIHVNFRDLVEDGADAILEALFKETKGKAVCFGKADDGHILIYLSNDNDLGDYAF